MAEKDNKKDYRLIMILTRFLLVVMGTVAGYQIIEMTVSANGVLAQKFPIITTHKVLISLLSMALFGFIGYLFAPLCLMIMTKISNYIERQLQNIGGDDIMAAVSGLVVGLVLANLLSVPFSAFPMGPYIRVFLNLLMCYITARVFIKRKEDLKNAMGALVGLKQKWTQKPTKTNLTADSYTSDNQPSANVPDKLLDTSVIIDGRILDIARTGFLEGNVILPRFVLNELQTVADSRDSTRRTRGRQGLDTVQELQNLQNLSFTVMEVTLKDIGIDSVDAALVALAGDMDAEILTTDYNLNKVAQIQAVTVLNVNDLANALKPVLMPGDVVAVDVIREGNSHAQGVGYLENGTMLVVEDGGPYIGKRVEVTISSMLQTSAGRMVFGRVKKELN